MLGKFTNMNFDFICKISLEFSKMGITFAYELGLKSFLYEKSSTRKVTSEHNRGNPVKHFQNPQKPNRKKVTGLLRSRVEKIEKNSNLLVTHHLLGTPLVTEKKLVSNFFFGKNVQNMIRNMPEKFEIFFQNFITLMNMNKVLDINKV